MPKQVRSVKSLGSGRLGEARRIFVEIRQDLLTQLNEVEEILQRIDSMPSQKTNAKKSLEELFAARDTTKPGSKEEERAAEEILAAVFPDTNAG